MTTQTIDTVTIPDHLLDAVRATAAYKVGTRCEALHHEIGLEWTAEEWRKFAEHREAVEQALRNLDALEAGPVPVAIARQPILDAVNDAFYNTQRALEEHDGYDEIVRLATIGRDLEQLAESLPPAEEA